MNAARDEAEILASLRGSSVDRADTVLLLRWEVESANETPTWANDHEVIEALASIGRDEAESAEAASDVAELFAFLWVVSGKPDLERFRSFSKVVKRELVQCLEANGAPFVALLKE